MENFPTLKEIQKARDRLGNLIQETPVHLWTDPRLVEQVGRGTEVFVKLELLQVTGTFKPRGALNVMLNLSSSQLKQGVTAVSAGNHAIAVAYAAKMLGTSAKVVMPKTANPLRMEISRNLGARIELAESPLEAFARVKQIEKEEGRSFIHPFEGPLTLQGTGTAGWEFTQQVPELDAMILPIGGGGLCGGFAAALKQVWPSISFWPQSLSIVFLHARQSPAMDVGITKTRRRQKSVDSRHFQKASPPTCPGTSAQLCI